MDLPLVTDEQYKEFSEGSIWADLRAFMEECIELNRDLLEGLKQFSADSLQESDDFLRGRNRQMRDLISYVVERARS